MAQQHWLLKHQYTDHLSHKLQDWLFSQDSFTARLKILAPDDFTVQPLDESWHPLTEEEYQVLSVKSPQNGWARVVHLCSNSVPWVCARSIAPKDSMQAGLALDQLGNRSLGETILFSQSPFNRAPIEVCYGQFSWLPKDYRDMNLWGRRTLFSREQQSLIVTEVFLPAFMEIIS